MRACSVSGGDINVKDSQDQMFHSVYYASGKTATSEQKYISYELEVLAIIKALRKFRVYLLGITFKIVINCQVFTMTLKKKALCVCYIPSMM